MNLRDTPFFQDTLEPARESLDEAALDLVGLGDRPTDPMSLQDVRAVLRDRYAAELQANLTSSQAESDLPY